MPGGNGWASRPPLSSPGMSPSPPSHPANICGIPLVESHHVRSITADPKIIIDDNNENVCLPAGAKDRERGDRGPQGGCRRSQEASGQRGSCAASQPSLWL